jgi:hypothetical protein
VRPADARLRETQGSRTGEAHEHAQAGDPDDRIDVRREGDQPQRVQPPEGAGHAVDQQRRGERGDQHAAAADQA